MKFNPFAALGNVMPSPDLIKKLITPEVASQFLMSHDIEDEAAYSLVDRLLGPNIHSIRYAPFVGSSLPIAAGSETVTILANDGDDEIVVLITCRRNPKKTLDAGVRP